MDQVADGGAGAGDPFFADAEDVALHFVQEGVHLAFVLIDPADNGGAGLDHFAQEVFFQDDVQVVVQAGGGGDGVGEGGQVGQAADAVQLLAVFEALHGG